MHIKSFVFAAFILIMSASVNAADFISLSDIYTSPMGDSSGWSISGNGSTIVGNLNVATEVSFPVCPSCGTYTQYTQSAYKWDIGLSNVTLLPFSNATDVSYDGSVVVGNQYRWSESTGAQDLGGLGSTGSSAFAVSADGSVVVGTSTGPDGGEAFRWTVSGGMQGLGFLPATNNRSRASDVSADGSVVVGGGYGGAFIWTEETGMENITTVGPLNEPFYGTPNAISADGSTVVGQSPETWIWSKVNNLQYLGMNQPAYAASSDGSIVVGGDQWSPGGISWIWDETNGVRSLQDLLENDYGLDLAGWDLYAALGISNDGTKITGVGVNPLGQNEAWFVDLNASTVPIPSALWLFSSGLLGLIGIARRKQSFKR